MQTLKGKKLLLIGFTLFSMFFGAGNLIFPPYLGAQAGTNLWPAFAGFAVSAIGLPIASVIAVARADGLPNLAGRVHPVFSQIFTILAYLSIGPLLAIPRTASTSFEMLVPLAGDSRSFQFVYSLLFFTAAFLVALKPEKLTSRLGRVLCPLLIGLIVLLFAGCLVRPVASGYGIPSEAYASLPAMQGILDGYQTMDAIAGLNFGAVIALNIQALGITEPQEIEYAHLEHRSCRAAHPFAPPAQRHLPYLHRIDLPLVFAQEISASFGLPVLHRPDRRAEHSSRSAAWYPLFAGKFASSVFSRFRLGGSGCCGDPPRLCSLISCETKRKCGLLPHFLFSF